MIIPSDFSMFMKDEDNKTTLLNLIEQVCVEENTKFHKDRVIYFSNETIVEKSVLMVQNIVIRFLVIMKSRHQTGSFSERL